MAPDRVIERCQAFEQLDKAPSSKIREWHFRLKDKVRNELRRIIPTRVLKIEKAKRPVFATDDVVKTEVGWRKTLPDLGPVSWLSQCKCRYNFGAQKLLHLHSDFVSRCQSQ